VDYYTKRCEPPRSLSADHFGTTTSSTTPKPRTGGPSLHRLVNWLRGEYPESTTPIAHAEVGDLSRPRPPRPRAGNADNPGGRSATTSLEDGKVVEAWYVHPGMARAARTNTTECSSPWTPSTSVAQKSGPSPLVRVSHPARPLRIVRSFVPFTGSARAPGASSTQLRRGGRRWFCHPVALPG